MNDDSHFASIFPNEEEESTNEEDDNLKAEPHFVKRKVHTELDDEKEVNIDEISSSTALINKLLFLVLTNGVGYSFFRTMLSEFDLEASYETKFYEEQKKLILKGLELA